MTKTIEQNFADWEGSAFGFGYGTGERHILAALRMFMETVKERDGSQVYEFEELESALTPTVAWLMINVLCRDDVEVIEYGTSPRYAWFTQEGKRLREFILSKSVDELVDICCSHTEEDTACYPDACNCGPNGYQKGVKCPNPFWTNR